MKDKLFETIGILLKHFYCFVMWVVYQYKTSVFCKNVVKISPQYKKEIRSYWRKYYRNISTSDFRWYQTKDNLKNIRLIPDVVFHTKIEPHFNEIKSTQTFANKCYYNLFLQGYKTPDIIAKKINGMYMTDDFVLLSFRDVVNRCIKESEIIIKPAIDSGGARNITFLKAEEMNSKLVNIIKSYKNDFVIQRVVVQHEELRKMNPTSLNCVRIQSFLYKGEVYILSSFLRVGLPGSRVDNLCKGGLSISFDENGDFQSAAYDGNGNKFLKHPGGYEFKGKKMPGYDKIIKSVKELHPRFANYGFIGWDIAVDEYGEPVFIEYNLIDTCIRTAQLAKGPLFQKLTDEVLDEVFNKKKRSGKKI